MYIKGFYSDRVASDIFGMETKEKCPLVLRKQQRSSNRVKK